MAAHDLAISCEMSKSQEFFQWFLGKLFVFWLDQPVTFSYDKLNANNFTSFYKFFPFYFQLSWNDALDYCKKLNMSLFSIENANEFDYLKTILKTKHGKWHFTKYEFISCLSFYIEVIFPYWLGAYKTNDSFKWISTGKNIEEFFWHSGEPNNKSGNENCIHTWEELFDWNDNDCERELPFICELEE